MKNPVRTSLLCVAALVAAGPLAFAHAHLVSSKPSAGSTVSGPVVTMNLKYDSRVDSRRSHLALELPDGKINPLAAKADGPVEMTARARLTPGKYILLWQALSIDGHITRGEIPFTVAK